MDKKEKAAFDAANPNSDSKGTSINRDVQLLKVKMAFMTPKSMREVAIELKEERSNICWYVGMLREKNMINVHHRGKCTTTGLIINYYTTDETLFRSSNVQNQRSLFDIGGFNL